MTTVYWHEDVFGGHVLGVGGFIEAMLTPADLARACLRFPILSPIPSVQRQRAWDWLISETLRPMVWLSMPGHE